MPDLPTWEDLFRAGRDEVLVRNAKVSRDAVERDGSDANILLAAAAAMGDEVVGQLAQLTAALYLDSAEGDDLKRLVFDRYGMTAKPAAASVGSVQFETTVPAPATFAIPTGVVLQTVAGIQFITTESSVFVAGSVGPLTMAVRSVLAGPDQNAKAGNVTSIISQISGAATDLVVSNPYAMTGADSEETDDSLRERARRFFTTARKGTMKALEEAALGVAGIRTAAAFEMLDSVGRPARFVQLVVADAFTEQYADYSTVPPLYQTLSQAISASVQAALADVRPAGVYVDVLVANVILQPVQLTLSFLAGADVNAAALQARTAIANYMNSLPPGSAFVAANALAVLQLVPGLNYTGSELLSPAGDVIPTPLQVLRASLGIVSAVAAQTDRPLITGTNPDAYTLAP